MHKTERIYCPNCGRSADRHYFIQHQHHITQTQCSHCDYLLVSCSVTGKVFEAYAPGIGGRHS